MERGRRKELGVTDESGPPVSRSTRRESPGAEGEGLRMNVDLQTCHICYPTSPPPRPVLAPAGLCPHMALSVTLHMTGPFLISGGSQTLEVTYRAVSCIQNVHERVIIETESTLVIAKG